jgi:hypothetical protein
MNAYNERWSDSKDFGARITRIEVVVEKIWKKSFRDLFGIFRKWLGIYLEIFSDSRGSVCRIDGLRLDWWQIQGVLCKTGRDFWLGIYFPRENGTDSVHSS